jgi:hypothetical protein
VRDRGDGDGARSGARGRPDSGRSIGSLAGLGVAPRRPGNRTCRLAAPVGALRQSALARRTAWRTLARAARRGRGLAYRRDGAVVASALSGGLTA